MIPLPFNLEILKWVKETQKVLSHAKVPSGVKFYNIYGINLETPHSVWWSLLFEFSFEIARCLFLFSVTNFIDLTILQLRKWGDTGHEYTGLTVFSGDFCCAVVLETTFVFTDLITEFLLFISPNIYALMVMEQFRLNQLRLADSPS